MQPNLVSTIEAIAMPGGLPVYTIPSHLSETICSHFVPQIFRPAAAAKQVAQFGKVQVFPLGQELHILGAFIISSVHQGTYWGRSG